MPDEGNFAVTLAQIDGRLETITQVQSIQLAMLREQAERAEATAKQAKREVANLSNRLEADIVEALGPLKQEVRTLQMWRERWIGIIAGATAVSGLMGGAVVAIIQRIVSS